MTIREIEAYETTDGQLFKDEQDAEEHQKDLIGIALDTLIPDAGGNITRVDRYKLLLEMMKDPELLAKVNALRTALS